MGGVLHLLCLTSQSDDDPARAGQFKAGHAQFVFRTVSQCAFGGDDRLRLYQPAREVIHRRRSTS
jgi:hypothetical protein